MSQGLSEAERAFVSRRATLARHWRWVGWALLGLRADAIPESTLVLMAGLLPVAVLTCLVLAFALLALLWDAMRHERRLLAIVARLESHRSAAEPSTGRDGLS